MTALQVLAELHRRQARVLAIGDRLRVRLTAEPLTDEQREAIRTRKLEIIDLLNEPAHPCSRCGRFAFPRATTCFWCRRAAAVEAA
jgi:hypothetical protein